ncbi:MAG: hypothetical protein PHC60_07250 [Heliobacteriaceae bacterium]|nr:hypothetical protein [Heliobacteriaceae bacterium]
MGITRSKQGDGWVKPGDKKGEKFLVFFVALTGSCCFCSPGNKANRPRWADAQGRGLIKEKGDVLMAEHIVSGDGDGVTGQRLQNSPTRSQPGKREHYPRVLTAPGMNRCVELWQKANARKDFPQETPK